MKAGGDPVHGDAAGAVDARRGVLSPTLVSVAVAALVAAVFSACARNGFLIVDDPLYLLDNEQVRGGLSLAAVGAAFTSTAAFHYHPLTWISHQLDFTLFGDAPGGHHVVSVLLHALTAGLLVRMLILVGASVAVSGLGALLFALHPARVESVAWAAERKDVLMELFVVATLAAFVWAVRSRARLGPALVAVCFLLALLSKATALVLPPILLLWELLVLRPRETAATPRRPAWTLYAPLVGMAAAAACIIRATAAGASFTFDDLGPLRRIENALVHTAHGLFVTLVPRVEPMRTLPSEGYATGTVVAAGVVVAVVVAAAVALRRRQPAALFAVAAIAVSFAPMSGLLQAGRQGLADRFLLLPHLFLVVAAAPALSTWLHTRGALARRAAAAGASLVVVGFGLVTVHTIPLWASTRALYADSFTRQPHDALVNETLARALMTPHEGPVDSALALAHARRAVDAAPGFDDPWLIVSSIHRQRGEVDAALQALSVPVARNPSGQVLVILIHARLAAGDVDGALAAAARLPGHQLDALLGRALVRAGRSAEALPRLEVALGRGADLHTLARYAEALVDVGRTADARRALSELRRQAVLAGDRWTALDAAERARALGPAEPTTPAHVVDAPPGSTPTEEPRPAPR